MGDLGSLQGTKEGHVDLGVIISLCRFLLGPQRCDQIMEFLNMLVDGVAGKFDSVQDFLLEAELILTSSRAIALFEDEPDIGGCGAFFYGSFMFERDRLREERFCAERFRNVSRARR